MIDPHLMRLGESVDRLVTVEFRPATGSVPAGLVAPLYDVMRKAQGAPLSALAADLLMNEVSQRPVLLVTGAGIAPDLPFGETDGPPGAVVLAHALLHGLNAQPVMVTEASHAPAVRECLTEMGNAHIPVELVEHSHTPADSASRLLDKYQPSVVIFVERDGQNLEGRYHGVRGNCRPQGSVAQIDELSTQAKLRKIPTLGIGDGGNEVGFGLASDELRTIFSDGAVCLEDCLSGRISSVSTDVCVAAGVSNWGAYGVVAALAGILQKPDLLIAAERERDLIEACLRGQARDGAVSRASLSVDGISIEGNRAMLILLHELVEKFQLVRQ